MLGAACLHARKPEPAKPREPQSRVPLPAGCGTAARRRPPACSRRARCTRGWLCGRAGRGAAPPLPPPRSRGSAAGRRRRVAAGRVRGAGAGEGARQQPCAGSWLLCNRGFAHRRQHMLALLAALPEGRQARAGCTGRIGARLTHLPPQSVHLCQQRRLCRGLGGQAVDGKRQRVGRGLVARCRGRRRPDGSRGRRFAGSLAPKLDTWRVSCCWCREGPARAMRPGPPCHARPGLLGPHPR